MVVFVCLGINGSNAEATAYAHWVCSNSHSLRLIGNIQTTDPHVNTHLHHIQGHTLIHTPDSLSSFLSEKQK